MTIQNIIVNGTDTLGQGVEYTGNLGFPHGYKFGITVTEDNVTGKSFSEFDQHLNRLLGQGQWTWDRVPFGAGDRRYYFRSQFTVELESAPLAIPGKPVNVAALVGDDPYTTPGDINFLLKGDRFRAEKSLPGGRKKVAYGTAAMDGNAISPTHGWLIAEAEGNQSTADAKRKAYDNNEGGYINVHFDHREPGYYDPCVPENRVAGIEYVPQGEGWPNEGLQLKDGWRIWVLPEVALRKKKALADAEKSAAKLRAEQAKTKAENAVKAAQAALAKAERELAKIS